VALWLRLLTIQKLTDLHAVISALSCTFLRGECDLLDATDQMRCFACYDVCGLSKILALLLVVHVLNSFQHYLLILTYKRLALPQAADSSDLMTANKSL
jgi:hypothetical protein